MIKLLILFERYLIAATVFDFLFSMKPSARGTDMRILDDKTKTIKRAIQRAVWVVCASVWHVAALFGRELMSTVADHEDGTRCKDKGST